MKPIDLSGVKFNRLLVLRLSEKKHDGSPNRLWECVCDCGTRRIVAGGQLKSGATKSCGCLSRENNSKRLSLCPRKRDGTLARPGQGDPDIAIVPKRSGIYVIKCTNSPRVYVGSAVNLRGRWCDHKGAARAGVHHSILLQRSWDKYGEEAFWFEVLEFVEDKQNLTVREQHWIDRLNACDRLFGFNMRPKADSPLGTRRSPGARQKQSKKMKGRPKSPEWRAAISRGLTGRKMSDACKAAISAAKTGHKFSKEIRRAMSECRKGKPGRPHDSATRLKMSASAKLRCARAREARQT